MNYEEIVLNCEQLDYKDKCRLAKRLIQLAQNEEENIDFQSRADNDKSSNNNKKLDEELFGLNFKEALDTHNAWKTTLSEEILRNGSLSMDATQIADDHFCKLGKWLYDSGKKQYSHLPEYEIAQKAHAEFHKCAAEIVVEHQNGNIASAIDLLENKFRSASNKNKIGVANLFTVAKK